MRKYWVPALLAFSAPLFAGGAAHAGGGTAQANPGAKARGGAVPALILLPRLGIDNLKTRPGYGFNADPRVGNRLPGVAPAQGLFLESRANPFSLPRSVITGEAFVSPQVLGQRGAELPAGYQQSNRSVADLEIVPIFAGPGQGPAGPGSGMARQSAIVAAKARALAAPLELAGRLSESSELTADAVGDGVWAILSGDGESGAGDAEGREVSESGAGVASLAGAGEESSEISATGKGLAALEPFDAAPRAAARNGLSAVDFLGGTQFPVVASAKARRRSGPAKAAKPEFPDGVPLIVMEVFERSLRLSAVTTGAGAVGKVLSFSLPLDPAAKALAAAETASAPDSSAGLVLALAGYVATGMEPMSRGDIELYAFHDFLASASGPGAFASSRRAARSSRASQGAQEPLSLPMILVLLSIGGWALRSSREFRG